MSDSNISDQINQMRWEFKNKALVKADLLASPMQQFDLWLKNALQSEILDAIAMQISTVDLNGNPDSRIVYLREVTDRGFVFYTNYDSDKGQHIANHNVICTSFFWNEISRQIKIKGRVKKVSDKKSDDYFSKRPRKSQIGAWASNQSTVLDNREELSKRVEDFEKKFEGEEVTRPKHWGGYEIEPFYFEFWQGQPSRLHDRFTYQLENDTWVINRLSP